MEGWRLGWQEGWDDGCVDGCLVGNDRGWLSVRGKKQMKRGHIFDFPDPNGSGSAKALWAVHCRAKTNLVGCGDGCVDGAALGWFVGMRVG